MSKEKNLLTEITEGDTEISVYFNKQSKKGPGEKSKNPFYNPSMELNRDISVIIAQWLIDKQKKPLTLLDGLAASGIRGCRFANELQGDFDVVVNDISEESFQLIKKNIEKNGKDNINASCKNLNVVLSEGFYDYIDIDPFGSPVYFVDSAMRAIRNFGIIACSATDTAALCGVYPKVCRRRYGSNPYHSIVMKEIGLRILLGFLCRAAAIYDKSIEPVFCYTTDHYFRVYIRVLKSVNQTNITIKNNMILKKDERIGLESISEDIGPLWMGALGDSRLFSEFRSICMQKKLGTKNLVYKYIDLLEQEVEMPSFFYTTESISSHLKVSAPRIEQLFEKIKSNGFKISKTHFTPTGFKTDASFDVIKNFFLE